MKRLAKIGLMLTAFCVVVSLVHWANKPKHLLVRYKLTLSLNTPEGVKTGSSVQEYDALRGSLDGEAVYVDLGANRRPLIALLSGNMKEFRTLKWVWNDGSPTRFLLLRLYGLPESVNTGHADSDISRDYDLLMQQRGARHLTTENLPDLVTFADINDRKTIMEVLPERLEATLGSGLSWKSMTFQFTDEPITRSLQSKLPFLTSWICEPRRNIHAGNKLEEIGYDSFKLWPYNERGPHLIPELAGKCPPP